MVNFSGIDFSILYPRIDLTGQNTSESTLIRTIRDSARIGSADNDVLDLRLSRLGSDTSLLSESKFNLDIAQTRRTINQLVTNSLDFVESEITTIKDLIEDIDFSTVTSKQLDDIQLQIESRLARIDSKVDQTKFNAQKIITGSPVEIEFNPITEEGFSVHINDIKSSALGLTGINAADEASRDDTLLDIQKALVLTGSVRTDVTAVNASIDEIFALEQNTFEIILNKLKLHETFFGAEELNRIDVGEESLTFTLDGLQEVLSGVELDKSIVSELLKI